MSGDIPLAPGDPAPVTVGSQVAGYRLMEQIGRGGMAVVYRAMDIRLDRSVALKILAPELAKDQAFRQRFIRESRAAAAVDHPYIIPVFDAGDAGGVLFIAMRYVSGRDVRTLLDREETLPAGRVVNIIEQVASALDAAHERGLVHRDVKPANMLLDAATGSGQLDHVYLSDFGLTKQALSTTSLTSTGQFLGTLDYIAPEQIEGRLVDGRADLYSLACTAFEMLAGSPPFRRDQGVAVIWAQVSAPPPQLTDRRPDLPGAVDGVLMKALAKAPDSRYQTCLQFAAALRAACGLSGDSVAPGSAGRRGPLTEPARWAADIAGAGAAPGTGFRAGAGAGTGYEAGAGARPGTGYEASAGSAAGYPPAAGGGLGGASGSDRPASTAFPPEPPTESALDPVRPSSSDRRRPTAYGPPSYGWPEQPGQRSSSQYPPGPPAPGQRSAGQRPPSRRRPWWQSPAALVIGCLVVLGLAGGVVLVLHAQAHRTTPPPLSGTTQSSGVNTGGPTGSASPSTPVASTPAGTVNAYFAALNAHNYASAWDLGGRNTGSSYASYVNGYGTTSKSTVTILSVSGNVVTARISALQTDGTLKTFQGTYTVSDGVINLFEVQQTG